MILLHAVTARDRRAHDAAVDLGLRRRDAGPVTVLYQEVAEAPSGSRSAVVEHGRRIVALAERVPLLPICYGTTAADAGELDEVAQARAEEWSQRLVHLDGRCELVLHLETRDEEPTHAPAASGRAYLEARLAQVRRQDDAVAAARQVLAPWAVETRLLPDRRRLALLVDRTDVDAVRDALAAWADHRPDTAVTTSGPWPPFSFCEEESR